MNANFGKKLGKNSGLFHANIYRATYARRVKHAECKTILGVTTHSALEMRRTSAHNLFDSKTGDRETIMMLNKT